MACCQQFVQNADLISHFEEKIVSGQGYRSLSVSERPSYPVELGKSRFTIPSSSLMERPMSPSESVSEESMSMRSEISFTDEDDDWQKTAGYAQLVIPSILKIFDEQKRSPFKGQEGKVRVASGEGGGGQPQQEEDDPEEEDEEDEAHDDEEDDGPLPAAPIEQLRGSSGSSANSSVGLGRDSNDSDKSSVIVPSGDDSDDNQIVPNANAQNNELAGGVEEEGNSDSNPDPPPNEQDNEEGDQILDDFYRYRHRVHIVVAAHNEQVAEQQRIADELGVPMGPVPPLVLPDSDDEDEEDQAEIVDEEEEEMEDEDVEAEQAVEDLHYEEQQIADQQEAPEAGDAEQRVLDEGEEELEDRQGQDDREEEARRNAKRANDEPDPYPFVPHNNPPQ